MKKKWTHRAVYLFVRLVASPKQNNQEICFVLKTTCKSRLIAKNYNVKIELN